MDTRDHITPSQTESKHVEKLKSSQANMSSDKWLPDDSHKRKLTSQMFVTQRQRLCKTGALLTQSLLIQNMSDSLGEEQLCST